MVILTFTFSITTQTSLDDMPPILSPGAVARMGITMCDVPIAQEKPPVMVTAEQLEKQQTQWVRDEVLLNTLQQQQAEIQACS